MFKNLIAPTGISSKYHRRILILLLPFVCLVGCNPAPEKNTSSQVNEQPKLDPIKILIVGEPELAARIERQWKAQKESEITSQSVSEDQFRESGYKIQQDIDVIIYPSGLIGDIVSRDSVAEIPPTIWADSELNKAEILRHPRTITVSYSRKIYAAPLGAPQLTVIYREDVLKALGYEKFPDTFEAFDKLLADLQSAKDLKSETGPLPTAVDFPLKSVGSNHWAANLFLSRVAPFIRHRGKLTTVFDKKDAAPLIASAPFVRALTELSKVVTPKHAAELAQRTPTEIYSRMLAGQIALGIAWPTDAVEPPMSAVGVDDQKPFSIVDFVQVAAVPGSKDWFDLSTNSWKERTKDDANRVDLMVFDGLLASVPNSSPHTTTAYKFLTWLPSKQVSLNTMTRSPRSGPFRASHLGNVAAWTGEGISEEAAQNYGEIIRSTNDEQIVFVFPRIPGRNSYLKALNAAVVDCLQGKSSPEEALTNAAKDWSDITEQLGPQKQLSALRKSEGR